MMWNPASTAMTVLKEPDAWRQIPSFDAVKCKGNLLVWAEMSAACEKCLMSQAPLLAPQQLLNTPQNIEMNF